MKAGDDVEDTVAYYQPVDDSSLLPQYDHPGPQVDCKRDQADWNVCKKVTSCLRHIHLDCHIANGQSFWNNSKFWSKYMSKLSNIDLNHIFTCFSCTRRNVALMMELF